MFDNLVIGGVKPGKIKVSTEKSKWIFKYKSLQRKSAIFHTLRKHLCNCRTQENLAVNQGTGASEADTWTWGLNSFKIVLFSKNPHKKKTFMKDLATTLCQNTYIFMQNT